jgi:hypothetical protein
MTDKDLLLGVLRDGELHSAADIRMVAELSGNAGITIHSRVSDLRREGYVIRVTRMGRKGVGYRLTGKREGPVRVREKEQTPVQGFTFESCLEDGELSTRNGDICQVVRRASEHEATDNEVLNLGPAFRVRFGDGKEETAYAQELSPWYPT